jgi:hypothetical protein
MGSLLNSLGMLLDDAVERCVAILMHLATLRRDGIRFGAVSKLTRTEIFSDFANTPLNVASMEDQRSSIRADTSQSYMNMRVFCVEMCGRHPFECRVEVLLHVRLNRG